MRQLRNFQMCYHLISRMVCRIVIAAAGFSFSAAMPVSAATISLDGTWQAEAVPEARGETIPAAFTRTIPVPGHWPLMQPVVKDNMSDALWCRTTWKAPTKWYLEPALPARTRYVTVKVEDIAPNGVAAIDEIEIH